MPGDIFGCQNEAGNNCLVGRVLGWCWTSYSVLDSPHHKELSSLKCHSAKATVLRQYPAIRYCFHCKKKEIEAQKTKRACLASSDCKRRSTNSHLDLSNSQVQSLSAGWSSFQELLETRRLHRSIQAGGFLTAKHPKLHYIMRILF